MSDKMQMNSLEMRGISDLLAFLEKWDEGEHGLYAKIVLSIRTQKKSDPDNDIGVVTFDDHDYYVFQGFNLDVKGIVKENYACKNCGTDVEIHRNVEEAADVVVQAAESFVSDGFGYTTAQDMTIYRFTDGKGSVAATPVKLVDGQPAWGPYKSWDRTENPDGVSPKMQEDLDTLKVAISKNPVIGKTYSSLDESGTAVPPHYRNVYQSDFNYIETNNPNGFGNHE